MKKVMRMRGLTIVEVMIALGTGTIILTALTLITLRSLGNSRQGSSRALATQYAQEGMETVRNLKDNNWSTLNGLQDTTYCLASTCTTLNGTSGDSCGPKIASCGTNVSGIFVREITIVHSDSKCVPTTPVFGRTYIGVTSTVTWGDSECTTASDPYCHSVKIESCFANFDSRSAP